MAKLLCWNVRGLNGLHKQKEVKKFIQSNKIGLVCLVETKIKKDQFGSIYNNMFSGWCVSSNFSASIGGRILVCWLDDFFEVTPLRIHA